jgi:hypothetical protein
VEAKRSTLPAALKLLREILREPAFPEAEFDALKRRSRAVLANSRLARALAPHKPDDILYVPTPEENEKRLEAVAGLYHTPPTVLTRQPCSSAQGDYRSRRRPAPKCQSTAARSASPRMTQEPQPNHRCSTCQLRPKK